MNLYRAGQYAMVCVLFCMLVSGVTALGVTIAADEASNYDGEERPWGSESSEGFGFKAWDMYGSSGDGDSWDGWWFLGSSHAGLIDSDNDTAFGLWASEGYYHAVRWLDAPLAPGQTLRMDLSSHWREGNRGIDLMYRDANHDWITLFNFDIHNDPDGGYGDTGWYWYEGSDHIRLEVRQATPTAFRVTLTRLNNNDQWMSELIEGAVEGFRVYVGNTGGGYERHFYINHMEVIDDSPPGILSIDFDPDGIAVHVASGGCAGSEYVLERSYDLLSGDWVAVTNYVADYGTTNLTDAVEVESGAVYYRVRVVDVLGG